MCGIVGYYGPKDPKEVLLNGLRKLEYRGYDSAGVSIFDGKTIKRVRASGKLCNLVEKLKDESFQGSLGIGHTRWATHGVPSERNAHPHNSKEVSLIHNGIIENYSEIRQELKGQGVVLESDTDSELVAHLLSQALESEKSPAQAVQSVIGKLRGAYSVLALWQERPDSIMAFKMGPPLIVGVGSNEIIMASDIQAIIPYTKRVYYLDDHEMVLSQGTHLTFFRLCDGKWREIQKEIQEVEWSAEESEKLGYPHFMLKEIFEQPRAVAAAITPHINLNHHTVELSGVDHKLLDSVERMVIVACGTSYYAAMVADYLIENFAQIPVEIDIASEYRYRHPVLGASTLVVIISQSGETADSLAVLREANQKGALTLSICNVKGSTIDRESKLHLYMNAGSEIGVASTKAFTCTLSIVFLLSLYFAKRRGHLNETVEKELIESLLLIPSQMDQVLSYNKYFSEASQALKSHHRGFLYMGRGVSYPIALEGALKLKELAYVHAEGYAAGEMKHGPLALIDESMAVVMLAPQDSLYEKTLSNLEEARARGAKVISIGTEIDPRLQELSLHYLGLPKVHWALTPLLSIIPLQLLAYHLASAMGHDVDQPRNLAKSVTVE